jgi:hypothetical protein
LSHMSLAVYVKHTGDSSNIYKSAVIQALAAPANALGSCSR